MAQALFSQTPGLVKAFSMHIASGPSVVVGAIATGGARTYCPITGGTFEGEGHDGRIVGGSETLLRRADGVTMVEASYYIAFADGAVTRAFGTGYRTEGDPVDGLRVSLLFEATEESEVADLATRAFIAERATGSATMTIYRII
jgi:hypothetical protein